MKSKILFITVAFSILLTPFSARADLFGTENAPLYTLVSLMTNLVTNSNAQTGQQFFEVINTAKDTLYSLNQVAETTRNTYALYKSLKNYTVDQLIQDIKGGLVAGYPDLKDLTEEVDTFQTNIEGIKNGNFFEVQTKWTSKNRALFTSLSDKLVKSSFCASLSGEDAERMGCLSSPVDQIFYSSLIQSGMTNDLKSQIFRKVASKQVTDQLCKEAESKGNSSELLNCIALKNQVDANQDIHDLAMKSKLDEARREEGLSNYESLQDARMKAYDEAQKDSPKIQDIMNAKPMDISK